MNCVCLAPKAQRSHEVRHRTDSPGRTWGDAPGTRTSRTPALKARFNVLSEWRFQRLNVQTSNPGALPRARMTQRRWR